MFGKDGGKYYRGKSWGCLSFGELAPADVNSLRRVSQVFVPLFESILGGNSSEIIFSKTLRTHFLPTSLGYARKT